MTALLALSMAAVISNAAMFEKVAVTDEISVTAFGVIEDTRCGDATFCSRDNDLRIAAIVTYRGRDREVVLDWNRPLVVGNGELSLAEAGTPANPNGAIQLKKYRLKLVYRPFETR